MTVFKRLSVEQECATPLQICESVKIEASPHVMRVSQLVITVSL